MTPPIPAKITRSASKADEGTSLATRLKGTLTYYTNQSNSLIKQINKEGVLEKWTKCEVAERQKKLEKFSNEIETIHINAMSDLDTATQADFRDDEEFNNSLLDAKAKLASKMDSFNANDPKPACKTADDKIRIEVQQTDPSGNIPNIWGDFDGDYAKWNWFRDKWLASMHSKTNVQTIVKFQNLQAACVGAAKGALGEWDLTDENYNRAWERLQSIYEDDYMQVQSFMQKLNELPQMNGSSSRAIRETIDIIQKHIHGLKRYVQLGEKHPYVVFAVINKMDTNTYRAWEKHRPSLAIAAQGNGDPEAIERPGQYIPTWPELERFLENEVTIRVHAERHRGADAPHQKTMQPRKGNQKHFKKQSMENNDRIPDFMRCPICDEAHLIYKCQTFIDMNIVGRLNQVTEHDLCVRCLRGSHAGRCANKRCNQVCPKCLPETKYHNSMLCSSTKPAGSAAMNATDGQGKRKRFNNDNHYAKRYRPNAASDNGPEADKMQSVINKVGEWSLKQSNAIKQRRPSMQGEVERTVLLATMNIRIQEKISINTVICRAIADIGATLNCITMRFVEENMLSTTKCQKRILGATGPEVIKQKLAVIVRPWFESDFTILVEFFVLKQLDGLYPDKQIDVSKEQILHLGLADEDFDKPAPIDALIGAEIYSNIICPDLYKHKDGAMMQKTELGHIILGKFTVKKHAMSATLSLMQDKISYNVSESNNVWNNKNENEKLQKALSKFWEIEEINKCEGKSVLGVEQQLVDELFTETYYREANGRYVVTIPIKKERKLGNSRNLAERQFMQLERRFQRNPELKQKYIEYMRENERLGYMRLASKPKADELCYWLPHHAVTKKFRVVLNASAKTTNGESLNSIQMKGKKQQYDVQLQTMRFRRHKYAVATDITKMFNRIGLNPEQWNLHRLFWRESENEPLKEYVMTVVIFGEASSPYNAVRAMIQCANDYANQYPEASKTITKSFYMDDGIFGCDYESELKILCKEVEFVLSEGHFMLKGWASNSEEVEKYLNAPMLKDFTIGEKDEEKILGLRWLKTTDELTIFVRLDKPIKCITKRSILGEIARLYDPNGFIAPIIIKAKMLMQRIWRLKEIEWDDNVPSSISEEWMQMYTDLPLLGEFKTKRWLATDKGSSVQIHAFCDASEKAYGTAVYVRTENAGQGISCTLLSAKSKVAPLKEMTIPRLELLAALMLSEQLGAIMEACEYDKADVTLWSDSMIVLSWIKKHPSELKTFVSNRIQKIQEKTKNYKWKHVCSGDNPADLVSRGMRMQDFLKSKLWLEGPNWLKQAEEEWPVPKLIVSPEATVEITKLVVSPEASVEIEKECKPEAMAEKAFIILADTDNAVLYNKFQCWDKIMNITAYVRRAFRKHGHNTRFVTATERNKAIEFWIRYEQNMFFKKEIECKKAGDTLSPKSPIASLRPALDKNSILRVGGRIDKANIAYEKKHQYIIPPKSRLSFLILNHAHEMTMHGGAQLMIQFIRKKFWIPKLRFEARNFIKTCVRCVRLAQNSASQIIAELPEIRLKPAPPFQHVGVDMAGPYNMRASDKINTNTRARSLPDRKGWIAVFVCLVTRAVHLEAVEGMSTVK